MCCVIDVNLLPAVFDNDNSKHKDYKPVFQWIINDKGSIIIGGSKFKAELSRMPRYQSLLKTLNKSNKVFSADDDEVDFLSIEIEKIRDDHSLSKATYNDPHIVALAKLTNVKLICSDDSGLVKYCELVLKEKKPKFYKSAKHSHLLCDENIVAFCQPCSKNKNLQVHFRN